MTVALLSKWGNQPAGTLFTTDATTEAAMIAAKQATATLTGAIPWVPPGNSPNVGPAVTGSVDPVTGRINNLTIGASSVPLPTVHPNYFCHLYAGGLTVDDGSLLDASISGNDAQRGANLSIAQMQSVPGYATTVIPASGVVASMLKLPILNFDFNGGESLFIFWRGKMPAPTVLATVMGDSDSSLRPGVRIRAAIAGGIDIAINGPTAPETAYGGNTVAIGADNTIHDFAFFVDGKNKRLLKFDDGVLTLTTNGFGAAGCDTRTTHAFCIGTGYDAPFAGAAYGNAVSTRTFVMMRWGTNDQTPIAVDLLATVRKLRSNPTRLLTVSDL